MPLHLTLSSSSPLNATYTDESGKVMYVVTSPWALLSARKATVEKVDPASK